MLTMTRLNHYLRLLRFPSENVSGPFIVLACAEDPPLIRQILTHIQRLEALLKRVARAPPDSKQTPISR